MNTEMLAGMIALLELGKGAPPPNNVTLLQQHQTELADWFPLTGAAGQGKLSVVNRAMKARGACSLGAVPWEQAPRAFGQISRSGVDQLPDGRRGLVA
jgi:hypothetical protein